MEPTSTARGTELEGARGSIRVAQPARGVVTLTMRGHAPASVMPRVIELLDSFGAARRPTVFFYDLWDMDTYESGVRVELTDYHLRHRPMLTALHTCTRSRIVRMGVSVANVALRIIEQHEDRAAFELALARAVERAD
jgi:hypothetical protein